MTLKYAVTVGTLQLISNVPIPDDVKKVALAAVRDELERADGLQGPNGEELKIRLIEIG